MSFLRDRLKQIAKERPQEETTQAPLPACAHVFEDRPLPPMHITREGLLYMADAQVAEGFTDMEHTAFFDIETTGLSHGAGTVAFEIGVGRIHGGVMRIHQLYMRDYDEEADMLEKLRQLLEGATLLVSFNGRSFDAPMIEGRMVMNRMPPMLSKLPNLDLLHVARRLYKMRLKSCTLSNLEEKILGKAREGDIPGAEIPGIWADFLKTGDMAGMNKVLEHNLQDVFSMALLLAKIHDAHLSPQTQLHIEDVYSLGRVMERAGRIEIAEQCYYLATDSHMQRLSGQALSRVYRRQGRIEDNIAHLQKMAQNAGGDVFARVELAKIYEHKTKDLDKALLMTEQAMMNCTDGYEMEQLRLRRARIKRKMEKR